MDQVNGQPPEPAPTSLWRDTPQESASPADDARGAPGGGLVSEPQIKVLAPPNADLYSDGDAAPEVLDHSYRPLLDRLGADCQRILSIAQSEAESLRTSAAEESRRIVADAHRERATALSRATAKQALMYKEAEAEIERWLLQLEKERAAVLSGAREEADRMVRAVSDETRLRANAYLEAAKNEAQRIVEAARVDTERERRVVMADATAAVLSAATGASFRTSGASFRTSGASFRTTSVSFPTARGAARHGPERRSVSRRVLRRPNRQTASAAPIRTHTKTCSRRRRVTRVAPARAPNRRRPTTCRRPSPRRPPRNLFAFADAADSASGTPASPDPVSTPVAPA